MTSLAEVASVARKLSRDFGTFFEDNYPSLSQTQRLPHPLIDPTTFTVVDNATGQPTLEYVLNARNGLLKVAGDHPDGVTVSGLYYQWFLSEDFDFYADMVAQEHLHHRTGLTIDNISGAEVEVMGIGALLIGLWSLLAEFATDIDVSSPEGMNIPAHQRFQQVQSLLTFWQKRYDDKAAMLNVGLNRTEMFTLRRISRLTNRYVPIYRGREIDNPRPPVRIRPDIDPIDTTSFEEEEAYWGENSSMTVESHDLGYGGWETIGSGGG